MKSWLIKTLGKNSLGVKELFSLFEKEGLGDKDDFCRKISKLIDNKTVVVTPDLTLRIK